MSNILTLRGEFFVGNLDPFDPDLSPVSLVANAMTPLGIVSKFTIEPSSERVNVQEWSTGNDAVAASWTRSSGGKIKLLADESNAFNLAINLAGRVRTVVPESVTGAKIAVKAATQKWSALTAATALAASVGYKFVRSISADGLSYDPYDGIDPGTFVLTDASAPTPKTLVPDTDYVLNPVTGTVYLKGGVGVGVNLAGLTYPLSAAFDVGLVVDTLPQPLSANMPYMLSFKNLSNVVVKDSSAPPKTIPEAHYALDTDYGMVKLTNLAAIKAISGITFPLKVTGVRGAVTSLGILAEPRIEKQVRMNGLNVRSRRKMAVTLYKVSFDTAAVDFFDKDYAKTPLEGELMVDPSRPFDEVLGQFGVIEYL